MANVLERGPLTEKKPAQIKFHGSCRPQCARAIRSALWRTLKKSSIDPLHTYVFSQHPSADEVRATSHRIKAVFQAVAFCCHTVAILKVHQNALQDSL